jgi:CubicO group peptidase (beta-lactamase class C family)
VTTLLMGVWSALRGGEGVAPPFSTCVRVRGEVVHSSLHGTVREELAEAPLSPVDLFDVGSLTQVVATAGVAASLAAEGRLELDAPVAAVLPGFARGGKEAATFRHLLAHSAGLPVGHSWLQAVLEDPVAGQAFRPPAERPPPSSLREAFARGRELVAEAVLAAPAEAQPGTRAVPSDAGFIVLGLALEQLGGASLAALAEARVFGPLGLRNTFLLDGLDPVAAAARAAGRLFVPSGWRPLRREVCRGAVHDDVAWAMGGAAGHAGVFSTAEEVAAVGQAWLDALSVRDSVLPVKEALVFARPDAAPGSHRALAWATSGARASLGRRLGQGPRGAIGHASPTGSSLWIDLDAEVVCALLANHTHAGASADATPLDAFRQRFHDAVGEALGIGS